jgi:hypothetical protein
MNHTTKPDLEDLLVSYWALAALRIRAGGSYSTQDNHLERSGGRMASPKSEGLASRLEIEAGADAAVLRQIFSFVGKHSLCS